MAKRLIKKSLSELKADYQLTDAKLGLADDPDSDEQESAVYEWLCERTKRVSFDDFGVFVFEEFCNG
jgi:hypothetical protein